MEMYIKYARVAYVQMLNDVLPSSDFIIDGTKELEEKVEEIRKIILALEAVKYSVSMGMKPSR